MTDTALLDRLCQLCGIELDYYDIWGRRHYISTDTKLALLASVGISARDDAALHTALTERETRPWRRVLPAAQVVSESHSPITVTLTLPVERARETLSWMLRPEHGEGVGGTLRAADLEQREQRELDGVSLARYLLPLPVNPGLGYHRFELESAGIASGRAELSLIVAPDHCYRPAVLEAGGRVWGPSVQLYALRSRRNWGIGDFTDLRTLTELGAELHADLIGVNPLHALFPHNPPHASPYSPSSRLFTNVFYIDVEAIPEFSECEPARQLAGAPEFQHRLSALRDSELVDYSSVAVAKLPVLERLYQHFCQHHLPADTPPARAFRAFQADGGAALQRHALFEALQEHFHRADAGVWGWPRWPHAYRDPDAPEVAAFAAANRERVQFFQYLQWHAEQQLAAAEDRALALGLDVGLYGDLAVSVDRAGAETWANQKLYAMTAGLGAPPDDFNLKGQNWGLPPLIPDALVEQAYRPFIALLRANMRHAGALRIDHVMGLMRLFWIPNGMSAADGAYVHYPFPDLLGLLALESQRNRCLVIGEDLGTVPDAVRAALAPLGVLSYHLLYFEKTSAGEFKPPADYPRQTLVAVSTHDLPTLAGFWEGRDLQQRIKLDLFPSDALREQQILGRSEDRARLLFALEREKLLPEGVTADPASVPAMSDRLARAIHRYVARSPAQVMTVQLEDVLGQLEQANLPGTTDERPNWRCKLTLGLEELANDPRLHELVIPRATYRLQFNRDFTFARAAELVPYLHRLGISHCYASPYLKARAGSAHGYDIVDHNALNPEIGSRESYEQFVQSLQRHAMSHILDMVPNHMGVGGDDNAWSLDVLENGPASAYAAFFDIDWTPLKAELRGRVLLPVLGASYGKVLENGELKLLFDPAEGMLGVRYYNHLFPLDPKTYPQVLGHALEAIEHALGREDPRLMEYQSLITAFRNLPARAVQARDRLEERRRDKEIHKRHLAELCQRCPEICRFIEQNVALFNGTVGDPASFDLLHTLLEQQAYRPAHWRVAADEINYRRFFDINDLAGLRMENPEVFALTHRLVLELIGHGMLTGLRIDHPDGLHDPAEYYRRLQASAAAALTGGKHNTAVTAGADQPSDARPLYVVAEKILATYERLPEDWAVFGTTGYDFANLVNGLFVYAPAERVMNRIYRRFTEREIDFDELLYDRKKLIMRVSLSSELNVLANKLDQLSESDRHTRDFTLTALRDALIEVIACFPVYRTYVSAERVTAEDRRYVDWAVAQAKKRSPATDVSIFDFVRDMLLLNELEKRPPAYQQGTREFAMRFQQYTAPVMAKGLEDTSFYVYNRLVSLNEVGGDPRRFGVSLAAFHRANQERARRWLHAMLTTSTHDSKRGEDVRARINVISELVDEWWQRLKSWRRLNRGRKRKIGEEVAPSANDEYLLYQTLVGAWPLGEVDDKALAVLQQRIETYMLKAIREAKVHTSWINPNSEYEQAMLEFVRALFSSPQSNLFLSDFRPFQRRVSRFGMFNALSQALLKLTAPGVPDIYQGNEIWDFSLVDPDNRRPVDYACRQRLLQGLERLAGADGGELTPRIRALLETMEDGRVKLYLTWKTLAVRAQYTRAFRDGGYTVLEARGPRADHLCAFARNYEQTTLIVVAPRWFARLAPEAQLPLGERVWGDTWLETPFAVDSGWINALTGETVRVRRHEGGAGFAAGEVLTNFPVALLVNKD
jgi:(1->4)-alpha-D-glucan 1-alpha-D-glucosylmutase